MDYSSLLEAVAPCGLRCDNCLAFEGGEIHRHAKALSELLGSNFDAYAEPFARMDPVFEHYPDFRDFLAFLAAGSCDGCRSGGCIFEGCRVPACSKEHGVDYCFQCSEFPCDKSGFPQELETKWRWNNEKMRDMGVEAYFELIQDRPRYPEYEMPDLRHLENVDAYFPISYRVFEEYFDDEDEFRGFFNAIEGDEEKNKFLYLSNLYYCVVGTGRFTTEDEVTEDEVYVAYFDIAYKYITTVSIIEDLFVGDKFKSFFQWVESNNNAGSFFPIESIRNLKKLHKKYKKETGAVINFSRFFEALNDNTKDFIIGGFKSINEDDITFNDIIKELYNIRSKFVHEAKCVLILSNNLHSMRIGCKKAMSRFSLSDFQKVFERGFLIFYGYNKDTFRRMTRESIPARRGSW